MDKTFGLDQNSFKKLIQTHRVVVVHFSHFAVMRHRVVFPEDLQHAIDSFESETRSCCAIRPGHKMDLPGSVGVIFEPTFEQVVSVLDDDSGSSNFQGEESSAGTLPTKESIQESLKVPLGRYNEWRVLGAKPAGIFVADPQNISVKKRVRINIENDYIEEIACDSVPLSDVFNAFESFHVYTMDGNGLIELGRLG